MGRKVFVSVLGYSNYGECCYVKDSFKSSKVRFIQEATLNYLQTLEQWKASDIAYILLTNEAEHNNWFDNGHKDKTNASVINYQGLCSRLSMQNYPFTIKTIRDLPHGNNEDEIWNIFEKVFSELQNGDELYFDLTHGFRYLPMLIMALINYSKFLKSTSVKSITYGNYESRNINNEAPIIDLLPLSILQDWTYAAGQFLDNGNVQKIVSLCNEQLIPILRNVETRTVAATTLNNFLTVLNNTVEDLLTCRGINIVEATNFRKLKNINNRLQSTIIIPLNPIFEKVKNSFGNFDTDCSVQNGFEAAKWYVNNGLYQQAVTILKENIVTYICQRQNLSYKKEKERELVDKAFNIYYKQIPEQDWRFSSLQAKEEVELQKSIIKKIMQDEMLIKLADSLNVCQSIRNDFNHAGMKNNPQRANILKEGVKKCVDKVLDIVSSSKSDPLKLKEKLLLNFSNHPYADWEEKQKQAAEVYGRVVDMPFPEVNECGNEGYVTDLAQNYLEKVRFLGTGNEVTIHLMGEMTFCFALLKLFQQEGYTCIASTSKRIVEETSLSQKLVKFQFERFRIYG